MSGTVGYTYGYLVLFQWDPDQQTPFKMFPTEFVPEIKEEWLERKLNLEARRRVFKVDCMDNAEVSLFIKVETSKVY